MRNLFFSCLTLAVALAPAACSSSDSQSSAATASGTSSSSSGSGGSAGAGGSGAAGGGGSGGGGGAEPAWTQLGLDGDRVPFVGVDKKAPATVFAGTSQGSTDEGMFRTTDGGKTWPLVPDLDPVWPTGLAVSPKDEIALVDVGVAGIFRSTDGGTQWAPTNYTASSYGITFDAGSSKVWLCDGAAVWRSSDGGLTWAKTPNTGLPMGTDTVQWPAFDGKRLYVAVGNAGVYASSDDGDSFTAANTNLPLGTPSSAVIALATDATRAGVVLAQTNGEGLYRTDDAGVSWALVEMGAEKTKFGALRIDPSAPTTFYVSHDDLGLLRSTDDGKTWTAIGPELSVISVDVDPASGDVYAGTLGGGVWRFGD